METDFNIFKAKRNEYDNFLNNFRVKDLAQKKGNSQALYNIVNSRLNRKQENPLPYYNSERCLAKDFITFFDEKIIKI